MLQGLLQPWPFPMQWYWLRLLLLLLPPLPRLLVVGSSRHRFCAAAGAVDAAGAAF